MQQNGAAHTVNTMRRRGEQREGDAAMYEGEIETESEGDEERPCAAEAV